MPRSPIAIQHSAQKMKPMMNMTMTTMMERICDAVSNGFEIAPPVYPNRRGSTKVFDHRILVDLCELVFTNPTIDAVAIVANPTNLVYLFSKLKKKPIVLLDDVFSELDETRRKCLVKNFENHQVVITSVEQLR